MNGFDETSAASMLADNCPLSLSRAIEQNVLTLVDNVNKVLENLSHLFHFSIPFPQTGSINSFTL